MWRNNIQYVAAISGGSVAYQWRMSMCQCNVSVIINSNQWRDNQPVIIPRRKLANKRQLKISNVNT
jgi:hypothetical protein